VIGIVTLPFILGLANIGGIGGGGLIIPLAIGCWGFNTTEAVAISNSTIFVGSLLRFFGFSIRQKHPSADKTVIDYDLASIMMPAVLLGGFSGLYLSAILPEALITIMLTLILCYLTYNTSNKFVKIYKKESIERLNFVELQGNIRTSSSVSAGGERKSPGRLLSRSDSNSSYYSHRSRSIGPPCYQSIGGEAGDYQASSAVVSQIDKLKVQEKREKTDLGQWRHHVSAFILICTSFTVLLLRGSSKFPSVVGIDKCGVYDFAILALFLAFNAFMIQYEVRRVRRVQILKSEQGKGLSEGEVQLTGGNLATLIFGSILGGFVGSMGLGGAIVFNPVLLSLGV